MALIVAGKVYVDPKDRNRFVESHRDIVVQARKQPGCLDLAISADPTEMGRINIFEHWESQEKLDAWRAIAPPPSASLDIELVEVFKHEISHSGPPFD
jgi:quinol monooxygenase YgiN